jgi:hypothetical protein
MLCWTPTVFPQSSPSQNGRPTSQARTSTPVKAQPSYLLKGLNVDATNVGPNFHGHDIVAIYNAINRSPFLKEKGEFETSSEFETRRAKAVIDHPIYANIRFSGYLGFIVTEDPVYGGLGFEYDADTQTFSATLGTGGLKSFERLTSGASLKTVVVRRLKRNHRTYIGSNTFGAKIIVHEIDTDEYGVAFYGADSLFRDYPSSLPAAVLSVTIPAEQARALKAYAKLMLVCHLSKPWLQNGTRHYDATLDSPYEIEFTEKYLQVVPDQLWLFDGRTGAVISKLPAVIEPQPVDTN